MQSSRHLSKSLVILMAVTSGLSVANLYYCQPLLPNFRETFGATIEQVGWVPTLTQLGYAMGMLAIVPLGDKWPRKHLVLLMVLCSVAATWMAATAPSLGWLVASSLIVGITSVSTQLLLPLTAQLSPEEKRGQNMGLVMSGVLVGILLSRTVGGYVGALWGWRAVFFMASTLMGALFIALSRFLPRTETSFEGSYLSLLKSLVALLRKHPALRESTFFGTMLFAAFSSFWSTLDFLLERPPFYYGSKEAGLFGLAGAAGALTVAWAGKLSDKQSPRKTIGLGMGIGLLSFGVLWALQASLLGLILGVVFMDMGVQTGHMSNQVRIYALDPNARSRFATIYMTFYFVAGALGSWLGNLAWVRWGWSGSCGLSALLLATALGVYYRPGQEHPA